MKVYDSAGHSVYQGSAIDCLLYVEEREARGESGFLIEEEGGELSAGDKADKSAV